MILSGADIERASLAWTANRRRNDEAMWWRGPRWRSSRARLWQLLDRHLPAGARVAIVGAGNGHDLPLRRLARRVRELWIFDLDGSALERAKRRAGHRSRLVTIELDVTFGAADAIVRAAIAHHDPPPAERTRTLPGSPFDLIVADLFYTQLLYPALADGPLTATEIDDCLTRHGQSLTNDVVRTLHASAPGGHVVHVHDLLGWWPGHHQPFSSERLVELASRDPGCALALAGCGNAAIGSDPRRGLAFSGAEIVETAMWTWPFGPGIDYLVCATVARSPAAPARESIHVDTAARQI